MIKKVLILLPIICILPISGCEQKPLYPKRKKPSTALSKTSHTEKKSTASETTQKKKSSDIGIADAADYATGMTQLKTKQNSKKRVNDSYSDRNKKLEKALREK